MNLSVVIPAWNATDGLARLLSSLRRLGVAHQVVIVDDGSEHPIEAGALAARSVQLGLDSALHPQNLVPGTEVVILRHDQNLGAGAARNAALPGLTGSHVLFFDADDQLTDAFPRILAELSHETFDLAFFRHDDSRSLERSHRGPFGPDAAHWRAARVPEMPAVLNPDQVARLAHHSAFPWNKIWRREFLLANQIRCTEIPLHNDLEQHWSGLIEADRIMATSRVGCVYQVRAGSSQLSHRRDADRLRVFEALELVARRLAITLRKTPSKRHLVSAFLAFTLELLRWIEGQLRHSDDRRALAERKAAFLHWLRSDDLHPLGAAISHATLTDALFAQTALEYFHEARP